MGARRIGLPAASIEMAVYSSLGRRRRRQEDKPTKPIILLVRASKTTSGLVRTNSRSAYNVNGHVVIVI